MTRWRSKLVSTHFLAQTPLMSLAIYTPEMSPGLQYLFPLLFNLLRPPCSVWGGDWLLREKSRQTIYLTTSAQHSHQVFYCPDLIVVVPYLISVWIKNELLPRVQSAKTWQMTRKLAVKKSFPFFPFHAFGMFFCGVGKPWQKYACGVAHKKQFGMVINWCHASIHTLVHRRPVRRAPSIHMAQNKAS